MLKEDIEFQLTQALKNGDRLRLSVFRMLSAALHNREIEQRTKSGSAVAVTLSDEETVQVIRSELKKRRDAIEAYRQGGRSAQAAAEEAEAGILAPLLPQELSDEALAAIIAEGAHALGTVSEREFGKLMGWVMGQVRGRASGDRVAALIRRRLGGG